MKIVFWIAEKTRKKQQFCHNDVTNREVEQMQDLIKEYKHTLRIIREHHEKSVQAEERDILGGMIHDLSYAIEWMETSREPYHRRGLERLAYYQREIPTDPTIMQIFCHKTEIDPFHLIEMVPVKTLDQRDRKRLEEAMSDLTVREREYYTLSRGYGYSYAEIAEMFSVSKSTIQTTIKRAEKKIAMRVKNLGDLNRSSFCGIEVS